MKRTNRRCAVEFDANGRARSLENLLTGESYPLAEGPEYAIFDGERVDDPALLRVEWVDRADEFLLTGTDWRGNGSQSCKRPAKSFIRTIAKQMWAWYHGGNSMQRRKRRA